MVRKMALLDWRAMKYYQIRGLLIPIFVLFFCFTTLPLAAVPLNVCMAAVFSINPFGVEEKGNLDGLYLTLPVSRKEIVQGRFLLSGIMAIIAFFLSIPIMAVVNVFGNSYYYFPFHWYIFIFAFSYLLYTIVIFSMYPLLFKLGYNKGKFFGFLLPLFVGGIVVGRLFAFVIHSDGGTKILEILDFAQKNMLLVNGGLVAIGIIILFFAYLLSKKFYLSRDF